MSKLFRLDEVKKSKEGKTNLIVIHNNVYDVTDFLNEHPGGEEVLLEQSGNDATEAFEDVGHSTDAREMMNKFKVGELVEEDKVKTEKKFPNWSSDVSPSANNSSWKAWLVPIVFGIVATVIYRFFLVKQ